MIHKNCEGCGSPFSTPANRRRFCTITCANKNRPPSGVSLVPLADRFWAKVEKSDDCWFWVASRQPTGYGQFRVRGEVVLAHRWSWESVNGPVPRGLELDHLCRVRNCVRPDHLEPVTPAENNRRGLNGILRPPLKLREFCRNGHPMTPENAALVKGYSDRYRCRRCAVITARRHRARKQVAA